MHSPYPPDDPSNARRGHPLPPGGDGFDALRHSEPDPGYGETGPGYGDVDEAVPDGYEDLSGYAYEDDDGSFEVELPEAYAPPVYPEAQPQALPPVEPAAAVPAAVTRGPSPVAMEALQSEGRTGISAGAAFFIAFSTQVCVLTALATVGWAFPNQTKTMVHALLVKLELDQAMPAVPLSGGGEESRLAILELEDRAIYRAERTALQELNRLAKTLDSADPNYDAANASLIRIRQVFQLSASEVPPPLDPREFFPTAETERDIPDPELVRVLRDRRIAPDQRRRAAYLLANNRSGPVSNALYHAIQDDPNLLVIQQAFESFRTITGYPSSDCFDVESVERWWSRNGAHFVGQKTP